MIVKQMLKQSSDLDGLFHALSDPARRTILEQLCRGPVSVSDLAKPLPMSLSAAMQHLQVLKSAGLVRSAKVGRVRTYAMAEGALSPAEQWINARRTEWEHRLDRLGKYLEILNTEGDDDGSKD